MHIVNLQAENIKKLTAIDITPTSDVVLITGANGAGKSSVLDCIVMALKGGREIPEEPIKKGADKGKIIMDLGEYTITRSFTKDNTYLKIESCKGENITSPQKFLDKIVGNISFDPLDFLNNEKKKQKDILLNLIGVDVAGLDREEKTLRDNRTTVGRDKDKAEALVKSLPYHPDIDATQEIRMADIVKELDSANLQNQAVKDDIAANEEIKKTAMALVNKIKEWEAEIISLQAKVAEGKTLLIESKKTYQSEAERISRIPIIDTADIMAKISELESVNTKIRDNQARETAKKSYKTLNDEYNNYTRDIESILQKRKDLLSSASMPVPNLSFDEGGLLYNDIPLDQCSDGEKLMISLGISMALNPTLRVLRIKDGSLLDDRNRAIIAQQVKDKGFQCWYESVLTDGKVGILIEEGEITAIDGKPVEKQSRARKAKSLESEGTESIPVANFPGDPYAGTEGW